MKPTKIPLGSVTKYKVFTGQVIHMFFVFAPYGKMSFFFSWVVLYNAVIRSTIPETDRSRLQSALCGLSPSCCVHLGGLPVSQTEMEIPTHRVAGRIERGKTGARGRLVTGFVLCIRRPLSLGGNRHHLTEWCFYEEAEPRTRSPSV